MGVVKAMIRMEPAVFSLPCMVDESSAGHSGTHRRGCSFDSWSCIGLHSDSQSTSNVGDEAIRKLSLAIVPMHTKEKPVKLVHLRLKDRLIS